MDKTFLTLGLCALAAACSSTPRLLGPASDTPDRFQVLDLASGAAHPVPADATCESPLVDPRDGMRLTLVRAAEGLGDYEIPGPRYGLSRYELLRVDCATGAAVGRVRR